MSGSQQCPANNAPFGKKIVNVIFLRERNKNGLRLLCDSIAWEPLAAILVASKYCVLPADDWEHLANRRLLEDTLGNAGM